MARGVEGLLGRGWAQSEVDGSEEYILPACIMKMPYISSKKMSRMYGKLHWFVILLNIFNSGFPFSQNVYVFFAFNVTRTQRHQYTQCPCWFFILER